ncbi:MAG: biosynthetic arginine decarboxylase [Xanthomonadales bacterium]|nr:biosynthetic arginine decarboxylase [Xanthomonadales bacterium]
MIHWSPERARQLYSIPHWGAGYVDVDAGGRVIVRPRREQGPAVALEEVVAQALAEGLKLPLLVRFLDILGDRLERLEQAFAAAMAAHGYDGGYTAVYPIKVNQQQSVVAELVAQGGGRIGLEAGSKPELVAVLAMAPPGGLVVCNGYKDREYLRLALAGLRLGLRPYIVIEKPSELEAALEEAAELGVEPLLGVRVRLASIAHGKWQNTGGDKGKFGLGPRQVLDLVAALAARGRLGCLRLLHFHMGSQISNVRDIAAGMREAVRYLVELSRLGVTFDVIDVGGGLGVDYEGTRSRSDCSINYGLSQYANTIVQPLAEACAAHGLRPPRVVTEAGRAMTAHHAVLIASVSEVERAPEGAEVPPLAGEPAPLRHLREILEELEERSPLELYHEAQHHHAEGQSLFALGGMSLAERAALDDLHDRLLQRVRGRLRPEERSHRQVLDELGEKLVDKYFVNFSLFQSLPDVWAIDQIFPILPISGLERAPDRQGVIVDLTCDSDGRIDRYVDSEGIDASLPLHDPPPGRPYRLAFFLVGAYQETLGDIHNLFGDTDAVDVRLEDGGWRLASPRRGDTTDRLLAAVGYDVQALRLAYAKRIQAAGLPEGEARRIRAALESALTGYTYLDERAP